MSDKVSWSDTPTFHNTLVVGSSPTSSTTAFARNWRIPAFEDVLLADPECGIAHWGIALSLLFNPHAPPPGPNLPLGLAAIQKAKAVGARTQRERDYMDATAIKAP